MSDNVELDPGTGGAIVSTEEVTTLNGGAVTGEHIQRMLLAFRTANATAVDLPGDAANGLDVDVTRVSGTVTVANGGTFAVQPTANATVNLSQVVGTAIDVNSGVKSAGTQRIVLATDQPALTNALKVDGSAVTQPVSGTVTANLGTAAVTNAGTFATQENGSALTSLQLLDDTIVADDAAFTVATTKVSVAGFLADQTATDSVNEGDAGAARMTLDRKQIVTVAPSADTEGLLIAKNLDIDETEDAIKATAGKLYGWYIYNDAATEVYVKLYNASVATVVVGTTVPDMTIPVPAGAAANVEFTNGISFTTAITVAATTAVADNDTGAPATNSCVGNFFYL